MSFFARPGINSYETKCLSAALFAALILRFFILVKADTIEFDGIAYATMGEAFLRGDFREALNNVFSPMYPLFIALFHLVIPDVELAARLVSLVSGLVLIYVSFLFAKRLFNDTAKALWVAFLLVLHPYLIQYSGFALSESLATLLFTVTVFSFYYGWQTDSRVAVVVSGLCLTLTYLTRPEYLVFYVPFVFFLLRKRRFAHFVIFLFPFLVLGVLYMLQLRFETGVWMVSRKATLSPFVSPGVFFTNIPHVVYHLFLALFPVFFVFAILGFKRVASNYSTLVLVLIVFHVLSLSFISHSTRRYSVEFIPIVLILAVEGIYLVVEKLRRFYHNRQVVRFAAVVLIILPAMFQTYTGSEVDRGPHKQAGLFLYRQDPGSVVACRLPLVSFYAKGKWVDLFSEMSKEHSLSQFLAVIARNNVRYLAFDEEMEKHFPFLADYLSRSTPVMEFTGNDGFVRLYRLDGV